MRSDRSIDPCKETGANDQYSYNSESNIETSKKIFSSKNNNPSQFHRRNSDLSCEMFNRQSEQFMNSSGNVPGSSQGNKTVDSNRLMESEKKILLRSDKLLYGSKMTNQVNTPTSNIINDINPTSSSMIIKVVPTKSVPKQVNSIKATTKTTSNKTMIKRMATDNFNDIKVLKSPIIIEPFGQQHSTQNQQDASKRAIRRNSSQFDQEI